MNVKGLWLNLYIGYDLIKIFNVVKKKKLLIIKYIIW